MFGEGPLPNRVLIWMLRSRLRPLVDGSTVVLRVRGVVTGSLHEFPVMYANDSYGWVVYPGRPGTKRWWRNLRRPAPMWILSDGRWQNARGELLRPGAVGYQDAVDTYQHRWPSIEVRTSDPLVRIRRSDPGVYGPNAYPHSC